MDGEFRSFYLRLHWHGRVLIRIFQLLRVRADYVVIGTHAINAYRNPVATREPLEVIMPKTKATAFVRETTALDPRLEVSGTTIRLGRRALFTGTPVTAHPLYAETLAREVRQKNMPALGKGNVASKEALIALKLLSSRSKDRKVWEAGYDLADAVQLFVGRPDKRRLAELLRLVPASLQDLREIKPLSRL